MNIAVGFWCLVAVAVTAGVTGLPEQQLAIEDQFVDFDEDPLERHGDYECGTKRPCRIAGGTCQPKTKPCHGDLRTKHFYCKNYETCGCCIPPGCVFCAESFPNWSVKQDTCMKMRCDKGVWKYEGIRPNCTQCIVLGDPHFTMFDDHTQCPSPNEDCGRNYTFNGEGEYVITQDGYNGTSLFGVDAHFQYCNTKLYNKTRTCVQSVTYYEPGINVTLVSHDLDANTSEHCKHTPDPTTDPRCAIKVYVHREAQDIGSAVHSYPSADGCVLVFNHPNILSDQNRNCVNIVGSKNLSVSLCIHKGNWDFTWLDVFAMPDLQGIPSKLYGLCDTNTGETRSDFTERGGSTTTILTDFTDSWIGGGAGFKPGNCPPICTLPPYKVCSILNGDGDCPGTEKCCFNWCNPPYENMYVCKQPWN